MILRLALSAALALAPATVERAEAAFAAGDYDTAAGEYARVYEATGDIAYLFARGEAERLGGHCREALQTYAAFKATKPKPEAIAFTDERIALCRAQLPTTAPAHAPTVVAHTDAAREPPPRPWHRDPAGASLVAFGSAGIVTGIALVAAAHASQAKADRARDIGSYGEHNDRAVLLSRAGIPVLAIGGALLVAGIVRYALVARSQRAKAAPRRFGPGLAIRF